MKKTVEIKQLLDKYFEGQTTLKEEKQLRYYFLFEEVDKELLSFATLFRAFEEEKAIQLDKSFEFPMKKLESNRWSWQFAAAAVLLIALVSGWFFSRQTAEPQSLSSKEILIAQKYLNMSLDSFDQNFIKSARLLNNANQIDKNLSDVRDMSKIYNHQMKTVGKVKYIDQSLHQLQNISSLQKSRIKLIM